MKPLHLSVRYERAESIENAKPLSREISVTEGQWFGSFLTLIQTKPCRQDANASDAKKRSFKAMVSGEPTKISGDGWSGRFKRGLENSCGRRRLLPEAAPPRLAAVERAEIVVGTQDHAGVHAPGCGWGCTVRRIYVAADRIIRLGAEVFAVSGLFIHRPPHASASRLRRSKVLSSSAL